MFNKDVYDRLFNSSLQVQSKIKAEQAQLNSLIQHRDDLKVQMANKVNEQNVYQLSIDILKQLIDDTSKRHILHLEQLINSALTTIFFDHKYSVSLLVSEQRSNNVLHFQLHDTLPDGQIVDTDIRDNGFGVQSVVGLILQVYFILYHKLHPILFMDESLAAISTEYLPHVKSLITSLAKTYNFKFVLVNHDTRWSDLADHTYQVFDGRAKVGGMQ